MDSSGTSYCARALAHADVTPAEPAAVDEPTSAADSVPDTTDRTHIGRAA